MHFNKFWLYSKRHKHPSVRLWHRITSFWSEHQREHLSLLKMQLNLCKCYKLTEWNLIWVGNYSSHRIRRSEVMKSEAEWSAEKDNWLWLRHAVAKHSIESCKTEHRIWLSDVIMSIEFLQKPNLQNHNRQHESLDKNAIPPASRNMQSSTGASSLLWQRFDGSLVATARRLFNYSAKSILKAGSDFLLLSRMCLSICQTRKKTTRTWEINNDWMYFSDKSQEMIFNCIFIIEIDW